MKACIEKILEILSTEQDPPMHYFVGK